ncbi:MAG: hybrid sensor histidine kinase/response regulator, partial [Stellaceae bacterium]
LGALAGMAGGALVWAYALLLPSLSEAGWLPSATMLGGGALPAVLPHIDALTNGTIWSLLVNTALLIGVSFLAKQHERDRQQAQAFVTGEMSVDMTDSEGHGHAPAFDDLKSLVARFLGNERAELAFGGPVASYREKELAAFTERLLSGAIGAASARIVVAAVRRRWATTWGSRAMLGEASEAILLNRDLLRATLENVSHGIAMFDPERRLAACNHRFLELVGLPEELAQIGTPLVRIVESRERRHSQVDIDLAMLQAPGADPAMAALPHVYERRRSDGRILELQTNPMASGGFVLVCTDITERTRSLEALRDSERRVREANEMLERRVTERTQELTALNEQLSVAKAVAEAANVGKTRFLAAASHDLLQPLHAARLFAGALTERPRGAKSATLIHQLDQALGAVDELLQALLDISKLDAGALKPQPRPMVVGEVLDSLAASFEPIAEQRGLQLRVVPSRAVVVTDPALLRRVLQNFVSNAIRYTRRGGVLIGCRRRGEGVAIEVWDTGPGIPQSKLGVIFEEFKRLGTPEGDAPAGLGLGLAIVDRIARILDHPVAVRSWPGRGSVFSVSLPQGAAVPLVSRPAPDRRAPNVLAGRVVLCIDNDASILAAMRPLLEGWSCTVLTVTDLAGARREIKRCAQAPDIILADHHLEGGETGMAAVRALAEELGAHIPAILITADYSEALREAALASGYSILHKPLRPAALRALMSQVLLRETGRLAALG